MKNYVLLAVFFASCFVAAGEFSEDELEQFRDEVDIGGVSDTAFRNDDREKSVNFEVNILQFDSYPVDYDMSIFQIHVVVELTDKKKNTYLVEYKGSPIQSHYEEFQDYYDGEDYWNLYVPYGDFEKLKVTGYAVQYEVMDEKKFVLLAEDYDDVDTMEELTKRTTTPFPNKVSMKHYFMYNDPDSDDDQSYPRKIKNVIKQKKAAPEKTKAVK